MSGSTLLPRSVIIYCWLADCTDMRHTRAHYHTHAYMWLSLQSGCLFMSHQLNVKTNTDKKYFSHQTPPLIYTFHQPLFFHLTPLSTLHVLPRTCSDGLWQRSCGELHHFFFHKHNTQNIKQCTSAIIQALNKNNSKKSSSKCPRALENEVSVPIFRQCCASCCGFPTC